MTIPSLLLVIVAWVMVQTMRVRFYRGYFEQKQANQGKCPRAELRKLFPLLWWMF